MYDKLVKRLRDRAGAFGYDGRVDIACDHEQAADAIEELIAVCKKQEIDLVELTGELASKPRWISVEERLPENCDDRFLVCARRSNGGLWQSICYYANNLHEVDEYDFPNENRLGFYFYDSEYGWIEKEDVTHWMPLPEPPKE